MRKHLIIRRSHRYLGLIVGIQLLCWTLSGLFFSWNDISDVHGDHLRKHPKAIALNTPLADVQMILKAVQGDTKIDSIQSIRMVSVAGKPIYQIAVYSGGQQPFL